MVQRHHPPLRLLPVLLCKKQKIVFDVDRPPEWPRSRAESLKAVQQAAGADQVSPHYLRSCDVDRRVLDLLEKKISGLALEHTGHDTTIGPWSDFVPDQRDVDRSVDEDGRRSHRRAVVTSPH